MDQLKTKWKRKRRFLSANCAIKQLQKGFLNLSRQKTREGNAGNVIEGYFSVLAYGDDKKPNEFGVLKISYVPSISQVILDAAEQEFGFDRNGVLVIPGEASELQQIRSPKFAAETQNHNAKPKWPDFRHANNF